jgi:hypothetical protein
VIPFPLARLLTVPEQTFLLSEEEMNRMVDINVAAFTGGLSTPF